MGRLLRLAARVHLGCLVLVALLATSASALGATPEEEQAFELYKGAAADFQDKRYEAALEKLEEAYLLFPKPLILMKKAEALELLGRVEEAHEAFTQVPKSKKNKKLNAKVEEALARLEEALARPVPVSVISGEVTGARIFVDGADTGKSTPAVLKLTRGDHELRLEKEGYHPWRKSVLRVRGINTIVVDGLLKQRRGQVAIRLSHGTFDDATVAIDGRDVTPDQAGATTTALLDIGIGEHTVSCRRREVGSFERQFEVVDGAAATVVCQLPVPAGVNVAAWAMVGGGGALFVAGTTFLTWHLIEVDYAKRTNQRLIPGVPHREIIGGVLMGVGAGVGLASLIFFLGGDDGDDSAATWSPTLLPTARGGLVGLGGEF